MFIPQDSSVITTVSSLIQLSVAPVFLLAGVAGLLNVFTNRLTRIIDKLEGLDDYVHQKELKDSSYRPSNTVTRRRNNLLKRMQNTNLAIFFATATGLMVALVIISVFFSSLMSYNAETFISILFVLAMFFLIMALVVFLREISFTISYIKEKREHIFIE
ncbi:MAG: DUF2721 domain-containing protein [Thiovulaceae bacterium]|nr:DUF2721 domain-containing protein [Sulfurimonadaceae bacterium]MCW9026838.1 DUF2721 domain-containing protein [Sulfurimonadaceae bacterium]